MRSNRFGPWFAILLLGVAAGPALAGTVVQFREGARWEIQGESQRAEEGGHVFITNTGTDVLTVLNPGEKTYFQGTGEQMAQEVAAWMQQLVGFMQTQLGGLGVDAQTIGALGLLGGLGAGASPAGPPGVITVEQIGPGGQVAGYETERFVVTENGQRVEELWIAANFRPFPAGAALQQMKLMNQLDQVLGGILRTNLGYMLAPNYQNLTERGFPMKTIRYRTMMGMDSSREVQSVAQQEIAPSQFQVPPEFRRVSFLDSVGMAGIGGMQPPQTTAIK